MRHDADSAEIKAVGVPACLDRYVAVRFPASMLSTRMVEKVELVVGKVEERPSQFGSEVGAPLSVAGVRTLVDSLRVMKDGEQCDNFGVCASLPCQSNPILQHSGPVPNTVITDPRKGVFVEDSVNDRRQVQ